MMYKSRKQKWKVVVFFLTILLALLFIASLSFGASFISPVAIFNSVLSSTPGQYDLILFEFRLPRIVLAILIGIGMAVSGAILQSATQNGLADPGILGINSGAGFAVILFIFFTQGIRFESELLQLFILPIFALCGALLAAFLIYIFSWKKSSGVTPIRLILVGIGINAAFSALIIILQLKMDPRSFTQATVWLSGNISGVSWSYTYALLPWLIVLLPIVLFKARYLNVLTLGDAMSTGLGVNVNRQRKWLLILAVGLAGSCVAVGGGISFLGLVAPQLAKKLVGPRNEILLPVSALVGAVLLLFSDLVSRTILAPSEIPIGLVVSAIGAPYFIYLLIKS
ncbi:iron ABC transporter permease [Cytobacillus sp. FSL W7-1323]|uniref:FecCD family ABC transporter permease n=2 Tax=Bacillaceae TaxID=186817 RepID=UPI002784FB8B|nr:MULTISPECIES: iron ABC transporter permease [Cytobacillus]MDQ0184232.1 iron complex transport system permease protein [Cytobacillus kochii]MEA1852592.1 iron ABC transporter permease [Cytobacillus sp. OWB-43]